MTFNESPVCQSEPELYRNVEMVVYTNTVFLKLTTEIHADSRCLEKSEKYLTDRHVDSVGQ